MRPRVIPVNNAPNPLLSLIARKWRPQWVCHHCRPRLPARRTFTSSRLHRTEADKPYYVTTPIFYVNAAPHVGHMYTMILADVLKRWQEFRGRKAILLTGTDEHGMKIQRAAAEAGIEPKEFCDKGAEVFKDLAARVDMSNDVFIRTTDQKHKDGVEYAWQMLEERGYIYESKHEGWYSVSDETFYPQSQVQLIVDPPTGRKIMVSIETGKEVEWTSERNYHFRLSAFRDKLLDFYAQNPSYIVPKTRMDEIVAQVTSTLEDLSISRPTSRLTWGVPVPSDPSQTIYVWLDALLNYATAVGYPFTPGAEKSAGWPPDVQVIGKDIMRFHCIYWPAFLMALDLPLPRRILSHAHWTLGKQKMSKSTGLVVNPFFALERFGTDVMRWFLIEAGGIDNDADYDNSFIIKNYQSTLKGGLGNLASRIMRGKGWDVARAVKRYAHPDQTPNKFAPVLQASNPHDEAIYDRLRTLPPLVSGHMTSLYPSRALRTLMSSIASTNAYLQVTSPWTLVTKLRSAMADTTGGEMYEAMKAGQSPEDMEAEIDRSIYLAAENLRLVGLMLQPFMPESAGKLLDMLGVSDERRGWEWCEIGKDAEYGSSKVDIGAGFKGVLFPPLSSNS